MTAKNINDEIVVEDIIICIFYFFYFILFYFILLLLFSKFACNILLFKQNLNTFLSITLLFTEIYDGSFMLSFRTCNKKLLRLLTLCRCPD